MTWWGWILEILGLLLLAFTVVFSVIGTVKGKTMTPVSLLIGAAASLVAATLFTVLSPARPPVYLIVAPVAVGLGVGVGVAFTAKLKVSGKQITSSQGFLHMAVWSFLLMISSVLVIISPGAARASVVIVLFSCLALSGYNSVLYARGMTATAGFLPAGAGLASPVVGTPVEKGIVQAATADRANVGLSERPRRNNFCTHCGNPLEEGERFCGKCGKEVQEN